MRIAAARTSHWLLAQFLLWVVNCSSLGWWECHPETVVMLHTNRWRTCWLWLYSWLAPEAWPYEASWGVCKGAAAREDDDGGRFVRFSTAELRSWNCLFKSHKVSTLHQRSSIVSNIKHRSTWPGLLNGNLLLICDRNSTPVTLLSSSLSKYFTISSLSACFLLSPLLSLIRGYSSFTNFSHTS